MPEQLEEARSQRSPPKEIIVRILRRELQMRRTNVGRENSSLADVDYVAENIDTAILTAGFPVEHKKHFEFEFKER